MLTPRPAQSGMTLIELVVGIGILGVLLALSAPNFTAWIQNSKIRTTADAAQNGLQLARAEAVRLNARVQLALGDGADWTVGCVTSSATCPASIQARSAGEVSSNVAVSPAPVTVVFNGLGKVVSGSGDIDITNPAGGSCAPAGPMRCLRVSVSAGGQIRMCDPDTNLPAANLQRC
ncbi:MAG: hypothetical protein H6R10_1265 [Rhodocyclaceae bacterium]|nr:hypothetical protein [Rhodocyclaceae bacterium]